MPPVVIVVLGVIGAFAAVKWVVAEAERINAQLHPEPREMQAEAPDADRVTPLRRDPASGVYRPD
jgi:hypothetical protein